jgi:transposase
MRGLCFSRSYYGQSTGHDITPSNEREKIVTAYELENTSIRKLAQGFDVSKAFVQRLLKQKKIKGHLQSGKQGGTIPSELDGYSAQLAQMVDKYQDATRSEYCEYWG